MTIPECSEKLLNCKSNIEILPMSIWLSCMSEYVKVCFPIIPKIIERYTFHTDFYKNAKPVSNWLDNLTFIQEEGIVFRMERNKVFIEDEPPKNSDILKRELFYTWKNKDNYLGIAPSVTYFVNLAYEQKDIPYTCLPVVMPEFVTEELQTKEMGEPFEVISALTQEPYQPITEDNSYIEREDFLEVYIKPLDCIIYVNKDFFNYISLSQLDNIYMDNGYLSLGDKYLHEYLGLDGVFLGDMGNLDLVNCR